MTRRAAMALFCAAVLLLCALSTGGALFWLLIWLLALLMASSLVCVFWTRSTLQMGCLLNREQAVRGTRVQLTMTLTHRCPLPAAPVHLDVFAAGAEAYALYANVIPFRENAYAITLPCPHVGEYPAGVANAWVRDVFGLFSLRVAGQTQGRTLVVVPQVHLAPPLSFSPGESDNESVSRAFEDATLPTDVRAYQPGDELKKVHWKLSMRRKELLVRVYEQPMRTGALLLVDCAPPEGEGEAALCARDAICEAAASLASAALEQGAPVRMPLLGADPTDVTVSKGEELPQVLDALGRCAFDGSEAFERVLMLETRRLRRTGSTAIVTSRMNPAIADMILSIRRMGPKVRVLLASQANDEDREALVRRLRRNDVEVTQIGGEAVGKGEEDAHA